MILRAHSLVRSYFAAIIILAFGALCFGAGLIVESLIAGNACTSAIHTVAIWKSK